MFRFLILALPLVLLAVGLFHFAGEALGLELPGDLPAPYLLGRWILEATALTALYVLIHERGLGRWPAGLAAGWAAWIFRGPVLALTVGGESRLGSSSWWPLMIGWLVLYTVCGLVMGAVAQSLGPARETPRERYRMTGREASSGGSGTSGAAVQASPGWARGEVTDDTAREEEREEAG